MGEPVRILDLARQMIRLAGLVPDEDIVIQYIGMRPGEKLHERLLHESESRMTTACEGLMLAAPRIADLTTLQDVIDYLEANARARNGEQTRALLHGAVPEFQELVLDNADADR